MDRITQYDSDVGYYVVIDWETECDRNKTTGDDLLTDENPAICKLVEYEDTNLTPSQVAEIAEKMKRGELVEMVKCDECVFKEDAVKNHGGSCPRFTFKCRCENGQRKEDDYA